jgi:hypothetical protein
VPPKLTVEVGDGSASRVLDARRDGSEKASDALLDPGVLPAQVVADRRKVHSADSDTGQSVRA